MTTRLDIVEDRLADVERILAETAAAQKAASAVHEQEVAVIRGMIQENSAAIAASGRRLEELDARLDRTSAMQQENAVAIAALGQRVDELTGQQQRTNQDMSVIKGWQTELNVERNARSVFRRLSSNGALFRIYPHIDISHYVGFGTRAGFMSEEEVEKIQALDFLLEGTRGDGSPIMYAVEVSYTAGYSDITRAVERAPLAAKMLGREVLPAVAAEIISNDFEELAQHHGVLWTYVPNGNRIMQ